MPIAYPRFKRLDYSITIFNIQFSKNSSKVYTLTLQDFFNVLTHDVPIFYTLISITIILQYLH